MRKNVKAVSIIILLALQGVLFTSCSNFIQNAFMGYTKKSPGSVNVSFVVPKNWKYMNVDKFWTKVFGSDSEEADTIRDFFVKTNGKFYAYVYKKAPGTFVYAARIDKNSIEELFKVKVYTGKDLAKIFDDTVISSKKMNGLLIYECRDMGSFTSYTVDGNDAYIVSVSMLASDLGSRFGVELNPNAVFTDIVKSINFKVHGFFYGLYDGVLVLPKVIAKVLYHDIRIYATANNGISYIIGYILGLLIFFVLVFPKLFSC